MSATDSGYHGAPVADGRTVPDALQLPLYALGVAAIVLTVGFGWQMDWAVGLWPWEASRLSYIFLASITAAIAAPTIWTAVTREYAALRPQAITTLVQAAGVAATCLVLYIDDPGAGELALAAVAVAICLLGVATYIWLRRHPVRDSRPLPAPVRWSFAGFAIVLPVVGTALILGRDVFPWPLDTGTSAVSGWIFVGAAAYFVYGTLRPGWYAGCGQLLGFLAYDVVLIVPFLRHFDDVSPDRRTNLVIYLAIIVYSALLAIYYLLLHPGTRLVRATRRR
jgi:hypothetical protein